VLVQAEEAVNRALQLDSNLAEAQASSGLLLSNRRRGAEAITKLVRATELRPSYAEAHNWLSWVQQLLGRPTAGLESAVLSVSLDPLSSEAVSNLALSYLTTGDYQAALTEARRVQEILPGWETAALYEGVALLHLGRFAESRDVLQDLRVAWAGSAAQAALALILEGTGDTSDIPNQITLQLEQGELFSAGLLHAAVGEKEQAMSLFQRIDRWDSWPTLAMRYLYPEILSSVRLDSRYPDLLQRINHSWGIEEQG
jgi:tetratricopeptide (TPR) repeat protein